MMEMTIRSTIKCMYESGIRDIVTLNLATKSLNDLASDPYSS
jgi:hypothetical protein